MKKRFIFLLLYFFVITRVSAGDLLPIKVCYDCSNAELKKDLSLAKTPAGRIVALHNLVMTINFDGEFKNLETEYIREILKINRSQHLVDATPYEYLLDVAEAIDHKADRTVIRRLYIRAIEAFEASGQEVAALLFHLPGYYGNNEREEIYSYNKSRIQNYLNKGMPLSASICYMTIAQYDTYKGDLNRSISSFLKAAELSEPISKMWYGNQLVMAAADYAEWGNADKAEYFFKKALSLDINKKFSSNVGYILINLAKIAYGRGNYRQSLSYLDEGYNNYRMTPKHDVSIIGIKNVLQAMDYVKLGDLESAKAYLTKAEKLNLPGLFTLNGPFELDFAYYEYYLADGNLRLAETHLQKALTKAVVSKSMLFKIRYTKILGDFYERSSNTAAASAFRKEYIRLSDSLQDIENTHNIASFELDQKEAVQQKKIRNLTREYQLEKEVGAVRKGIIWVFTAALAIVVTLIVIVYRQLRANRKVLTSLKETQKQLIQSEKMAAMGEVTAGIAHEIQNPLNFVNNFSDVSVELLQELKEEAGKGDLDEVNAIADDVIQNLEKIAHHGRRADGIVKGMLQHSRASSGQKEPTDINALADEYLRLAYHGLRAKNKSFNAELVTNFDESLPKINMIPQDMGRVLLNLFTNAFYATQEKSRQSQSQFSGDAYKPTVTVTTRQKGNSVEIRVKDNGTGIPDAIKDKILQPFFTTKPTGEGTGLGLSLSYDIIVKGHNGTITIDSKEGEYSEFTITLDAV